MTLPVSFHPAVRSWFTRRFGEPTPAQRDGWPAIRSGRHTLIAAPTGSGKTLAAFLSAIDSLVSRGETLPDATSILYVSPLRALSNDVKKNLEGPLAEIRAESAGLPEVRVLELATRHDFMILEDDIYGDLQGRHSPRLASLDDGRRVIYVGGFSKTLAASLRVGFIAAQPAP